MRENSITEHFPKIVRDYMVTSFTGQKLDQSFGDQYWEFPDGGGLMQVFEAIADVAEDLIKDYEERLSKVTYERNVAEISMPAIHICEGVPLPPSFVDPPINLNPPLGEPVPFVEGVTALEPKVRKKRGPNKKKPCVACEGSGNNSKGGICPICKPTETKAEESFSKQEIVDAIAKHGAPENAPVPPLPVSPTNLPPWLAPKVEPASPAFFPPPPPPPFWNPNA